MNDLLDRFAEALRKTMAFIGEKAEDVLDALCGTNTSDLAEELARGDNARDRRNEADLKQKALDRETADVLARLVIKARKCRHRTDKPKARHRARNTV